MSNILILHGPNLNLLGHREPNTYGSARLEVINQQLKEQASSLGHHLICHQSNAEHELVDHIQKAHSNHVQFIIINPAAYTHTSIALRDALLSVNIPFIEVHLSNIQAREPFRHTSYLSDIAAGVMMGFGAYGYRLALDAADHSLQHRE